MCYFFYLLVLICLNLTAESNMKHGEKKGLKGDKGPWPDLSRTCRCWNMGTQLFSPTNGTTLFCVYLKDFKPKPKCIRVRRI